jgi:tellurium resistance protein TerZ
MLLKNIKDKFMALNLTKGDKLNLIKDNGTKLNNICVGLNWGAIVKVGMFEAVDLDSSAVVFNTQNVPLDVIYFGKPKRMIDGVQTIVSDDGAIKHSGDDLTGDLDGDDGLDNEIITVDLRSLRPEADKILFLLNSFKGQDFATIPYAYLRIYEGTATRVDNVFAKFNVAAEAKYKGAVSMVMGKLYKYKGEWKFETIGEPTPDRQLRETIQSAIRYL